MQNTGKAKEGENALEMGRRLHEEVSWMTDLEWVDLNMQGVQTIRLCTLTDADR